MKINKTIISILGLIVILLTISFLLLVLQKKSGWTYWTGNPIIDKEVVAIVWLRPEISAKKSYKKFIAVSEIKEILKQVATPMPGEFPLKEKEKHELRIYFLNGENYHLYFNIEGEEFIGPNGKNRTLFNILNNKEEARPFWENTTPEEIEKQAELMKDIIIEKRKLEDKGL